MDQEILNSYSKLNDLNVSRETFLDFENYVSMIIEKNKKINIISQKTSSKKYIIERHIIDSAQIIDFVDFNQNTTIDLGSGGGMPGIVVAIILKNMKNSMNVHLYEKSYHKSRFLEEVSEKLNLNTKIFQKNIFEIKNLETGTIMSRAFKPMPIVLDLVYENFSKYKNLIFFMGKSGKKIFENSKNDWNFEYIEKKSLTNEDSFLLNIKKITKKNKKDIRKIKCKLFQ
jgi:16S rRNA (guanine527-N7)-methyltransferase